MLIYRVAKLQCYFGGFQPAVIYWEFRSRREYILLSSVRRGAAVRRVKTFDSNLRSLARSRCYFNKLVVFPSIAFAKFIF